MPFVLSEQGVKLLLISVPFDNVELIGFQISNGLCKLIEFVFTSLGVFFPETLESSFGFFKYWLVPVRIINVFDSRSELSDLFFIFRDFGDCRLLR